MPSDESGDKHIARLTAKKTHKPGCVTKHQDDYTNDTCAYRWNGYEEMKANRKSIYHLDFTKESNAKRLPWIYHEFKIGSAGGKSLAANFRFANDPTVDKEAWWFKGQNFKMASLPYVHNYHHILPFDAIKKLTYPELEILQAAKYNLNGKENMIILPCLAEYGIAMKLPSHPTNHPVYNAEVKGIIEQVKQEVCDKKDKHKIKPANVSNFRTELENWEKRQFDEIVEYGEFLADTLDPENVADRNQINGCPMATL
jgi:A nuclease family of the HNH/ENDO VII superfamily with conserved AHH